MGWTLWAFRRVDDEWRRVPWAWYERFTAGREALPEPERTLVRFSQAALELEEREPVRLGQLWFVLHQLGEDGFIDQEREQESLRSALESVDLFGPGSDDKVVAAAPRFARRRHRRRPGNRRSRTRCLCSSCYVPWTCRAEG